MNLFRTTKLALRNMLANKMRAGLSSLGIIIGVFSVVVLLAVGEGATSSIVSKVSALGTNLLTISPGKKNSGDVRQMGGGNTKIFTMDHADIIKKVEHVSKVAPLITTSKQLVYSSNNTSAQIYGVTPEYETVNNTTVTAGTFITQAQLDAREKVVVLGPTVVSNLFGTEDPLGKSVKIGNGIYTVIGVTKSK